jgi:hypothetical protein
MNSEEFNALDAYRAKLDRKGVLVTGRLMPLDVEFALAALVRWDKRMQGTHLTSVMDLTIMEKDRTIVLILTASEPPEPEPEPEPEKSK